MPLRDWGLGLEELTEYYHRYGLYFTDFKINWPSQNWFITRGIVDQTPQRTTHKKSKKTFGFWSPMEIDLVGFRINYKCEIEEVRLIECKEKVTPAMVPRIARSMLMPRIGGLTIQAEKQKMLTKLVSYVTISPTAKKRLEANNIQLLSFDTMIEKLLQLNLSLRKIKRKGFAREPPLWMLDSLERKGFFAKERIERIRKTLEKP